MKDDELILWLWLLNLKGIGPVTQHKLLEQMTIFEIYELNEKGLKWIEGITGKQAKELSEDKDLKQAEEIYSKMMNKNMRLLTINDTKCPAIFKKQRKLPVAMYYQGTLPHKLTGTGVIGARRCSREGKEKVIELVSSKLPKDEVIISGMAKGIDGYAHTAALKSGHPTIAVLGCGTDVCYPREHEDLKAVIEKKGILLSEYPPGTPPIATQFPSRNRIIAALSEQLFVIDAGKNSGTQYTEQFAKEYNVKTDKQVE